MLRAIAAVFAGAAVAMLTVLALESLGHIAFPPPRDFDGADPAALRAVMDAIPLGAKIVVILAWIAGAFVGAATALGIARGPVWPAWLVAGLVVAAGVATMIQIPHPLWMQVTGILGPALAAGAAQAWLGRKPLKAPG